jgi:hypothetical protein
MPMNQNRNNNIKYAVVMVLVIIIIVVLTMVNLQFSKQNPGGNDFLARWNGAHEWLINGSNPYTNQVSEVAQKMIYGRLANPLKGEDVAHFVYPIYSMLFFAPFALMDYTLARAVWMTVLELAMVALTFISLRLSGWKIKPISLAGILIFSILWYCSVRTIILGQFSGINALLILISLLCIKTEHDQVAGILLALSTSKPQMSYLLIIFVIFWAIRSSRHRIWISFFAAMIIMTVVGWLLLPGWPVGWIQQLMNYPGYTDRIGSIVSIIAGVTPGIKDQVSTGLMIVFYVYMVFEWLRTRGNDIPTFLWTAYVTLVITNFVAYRTATPHYVALLAPIFLVSKVIGERWGAFGKWVTGATYIILFAGLWMLFILTIKGNDEQAIMYLPVPVVTLIGLWWTRWWAIRPPTRLVEG